MNSEELDSWLSGPTPRRLTPQISTALVENRGARLGCGVVIGLFTIAFVLVVAVGALGMPQGFVDLGLDMDQEELMRLPCQVTRVGRFSVPRGPSGHRVEYSCLNGTTRGVSYFVRAIPPEQGAAVWVEQREGESGHGRIVGSRYSMHGSPLPGAAALVIMMPVGVVALLLPIVRRRRELRLLRLGRAATGTLRWRGRAIAVVAHQADGQPVEATVSFRRHAPETERLKAHQGPVRLLYDPDRPGRVKVLEHLVATAPDPR